VARQVKTFLFLKEKKEQKDLFKSIKLLGDLLCRVRKTRKLHTRHMGPKNPNDCWIRGTAAALVVRLTVPAAGLQGRVLRVCLFLLMGNSFVTAATI
jgi:hypothetical protein